MAMFKLGDIVLRRFSQSNTIRRCGQVVEVKEPTKGFFDSSVKYSIRWRPNSTSQIQAAYELTTFKQVDFELSNEIDHLEDRIQHLQEKRENLKLVEQEANKIYKIYR